MDCKQSSAPADRPITITFSGSTKILAGIGCKTLKERSLTSCAAKPNAATEPEMRALNRTKVRRSSFLGLDIMAENKFPLGRLCTTSSEPQQGNLPAANLDMALTLVR